MDEIFTNEPTQWGLRGDPKLWKAMKVHFTSVKLPGTVSEFEQLVKEAFRTLTGEEITSGKDIYIEKYNIGGISGGIVSSSFWLATLLPLLKSRFEERVQNS